MVRISDIRLGVGVTDGSQEPDQEPKIVNGDFVVDRPADKQTFNQKWGISASQLPFGRQTNDAYKAELGRKAREAKTMEGY